MYGKAYWLTKGFTEIEAVNRAMGLSRCSYCRRFFMHSNSLSTGKPICSHGCLEKDKEQRLNAMIMTKRMKAKKRCIVCGRFVSKSNSHLSYKYVCSSQCLNEYKGKLPKKTSIKNTEYWVNKGYNIETAKLLVSELQRKSSPRCVEYWINKGYTEEESNSKVSEHQQNNLAGYTSCRSDKIFCKEYYLKQGHDETTAIDLAYEAASNTKKEKFIERYGVVTGTQKYEEYIRNIKYYVSEKYFIAKYGEKEGRIKYAQKFINSNPAKVSCVSKWLFSEVDKALSIDTYILYEPKCKEYFVRHNEGIYFYDFVIPTYRICIELNGSYWHKDPDKFHYDSPIVQETWERDYHKHKVISNKGYTVFYIWYQSNRKFRFNNKIFNKHQIVDAIVQEINHEIN